MLDQWDRLICFEATRSFVKFQEHYAWALPYEADDFVQCGRIAVWKLADPPADAEYAMSTYIINTVRWRCSDMVRQYSGVRRNQRREHPNPTLWTSSLDAPTGDDGTQTYLELQADPGAEQAFADVDNELTKINVDLSHLSERDQGIVRMRLGGATYKEIAKRFGVSQGRICQIVTRLYGRLRTELGLG